MGNFKSEKEIKLPSSDFGVKNNDHESRSYFVTTVRFWS